MTQEEKEKAKAYDEAIDKVAHFIKKHIGLGCIIHPNSSEAKELFNIFPELKESEGERIRKALINMFKGCNIQKVGDFTDKEIIAWLEKQGTMKEKKPKKDPCIGCYYAINHKCAIDIKGYCPREKPFDYENANIPQRDFAPKEKSKFKVGDLVVLSTSDGEKVVRIDSIEYFKSGEPMYITSEGRWFGNGTKAHLWSIKDAKDGDVLAASDGSIFIFKEVFDLGCKHYIALEEEDGTIQVNDNFAHCWESVIGVCPATKEQRDTLLKAMANAGYTFDFKKNELKKVEPTDKYKGLTDFERTLADICIGWIGEELGWKQYIKDNADVLLKIAAKKFNSVQDVPFEQVPAWSEEDKNFMYDTLSNLTELKDRYGEGYGNVGKCIKWLKSIKEKVQPQNTWKPSDEQNEALEHFVRSIGESGYASPYDNNTKLLYSLLEQLKKLKG